MRSSCRPNWLSQVSEISWIKKGPLSAVNCIAMYEAQTYSKSFIFKPSRFLLVNKAKNQLQNLHRVAEQW